MREEFSTFDIVKALEIPKGRLREWIIADYVKPTIPAEGPGTKAIFTRDDVYCVEFFRFLISRGFKRDEAAGILKMFKENVKFKPSEIWRLMVKYKGKIAVVLGIGKDSEKYHTFLDVGNSFIAMNVPKDLPEQYKKKIGHKKTVVSTIEQLSGYDKKLPENFGDPLYWDAIMIYNFEEIRRKVDKALDALE